MNIQSIILLTVVLAAFVIIGYRYVKAQKKGGNCGSCSCGNGGCNTFH